MAHSSYDCCAVCDRKMGYNPGEPTTKEEICTQCLKGVRALCLPFLDGMEMVAWVNDNDAKIVEDNLRSLGFATCIFDNPVDDAVKAKCGLATEAWWRTLFRPAEVHRASQG